MDTARTSNIKSVGMIAFVSIMLFGVFYYLITDAIGNPSVNLKTESDPTTLQVSNQKVTEQRLVENEMMASVKTADFTAKSANQPTTADVKGDSTEGSVFKALTTQKVDVQPKMVLGGADETTPESTVPDTGTDAIFMAFVASSLIMFAGIYMLMNQRRNTALAKFERRIIRELD